MALVAAIDLCPKVWILDMAALPPKVPADYRLTIKIVLADGTTGDWNYDIYAGAEPDALQSLIYTAFVVHKNTNVQQDGLRVVVGKLEGKDIRRITVQGDGPLPTVRWEFARPPKK